MDDLHDSRGPPSIRRGNGNRDPHPRAPSADAFRVVTRDDGGGGALGERAVGRRECLASGADRVEPRQFDPGRGPGVGRRPSKELRIGDASTDHRPSHEFPAGDCRDLDCALQNDRTFGRRLGFANRRECVRPMEPRGDRRMGDVVRAGDRVVACFIPTIAPPCASAQSGNGCESRSPHLGRCGTGAPRHSANSHRLATVGARAAPAEQEIIVAHERQHAAAFDPGLVCASMCIVAIQPWNPALWMLLARLRLAVEADCDGRVLGEGCDARAYGQLLVEMYERTSGLSPHVAFAERPSNLERRIRRIASRPRLFSAAVGASAIAATVFATAAWTTSAPTRTAPLLSPAVSAIAILRGLVPGATAAPMPSAGSADSVPRSGAAEPVREDPQAIVHFDSRAAEPETVTFRQIVIAANDSNDVIRAARLADSVGDLLRRGAPFDSLARRFHDYSINELTNDLTPWPVDAMPSYYRKGFAGAHAGDIVVFEVTGLRRPRFVVAQLLTVQPGELHQALAQRIDPISGLPEAVPAAAMLAQTSSIRVTVESPNHAQYRLAVPQDSAMRPVLLRGRAVSDLGAPAGPDAPYSVMEIMSLDSTSQIHVEAAQTATLSRAAKALTCFFAETRLASRSRRGATCRHRGHKG